MMTEKQQRKKRGDFIRWLRNTHGWLGLWGAALGLLFGVTGVLLNHRNIMKLPYAQYEKAQMELSVPAAHLHSAKELGAWLQAELKLTKPPLKVEEEPAREVVWRDAPVMQPAAWKVDFHTPQYSVTAEYLVGNRFVSIKRQDANLWAFLSRLHKGVGVQAGWILLVDSLAGAIMVLSITGVLLWTKMRKSRLVLASLCGGSILVSILLGWFSL